MARKSLPSPAWSCQQFESFSVLQLKTVQLGTEWEYHFAAPKRATWAGEGLAWAEREFNQLGRDGWELVGFLEHGTAVFKRRLARS